MIHSASSPTHYSQLSSKVCCPIHVVEKKSLNKLRREKPWNALLPWRWKQEFSLWGETSPLCVTNIIKMKRNSSLNTTNDLLAKMANNFHTPPPQDKKRNTYHIISPSEDSHTLPNNRPTPFFHPPEQTRAAICTQYFTLCALDLLG